MSGIGYRKGATVTAEDKGQRIEAALRAYVEYDRWQPGDADEEDWRPNGYKSCLAGPSITPNSAGERPSEMVFKCAIVTEALRRIVPQIIPAKQLIEHYVDRRSIKGFRVTRVESDACRLACVSEEDLIIIWWHKIWREVSRGVL